MAFIFVIAAVPMIGMVALGAEAGSWYVTKQHAQNAADAAAYSGALRLACTVAAQTGCDSQTVAQHGKQFAAKNAFCDAGDTTTPGCPVTLANGVSQAVTINTLTSWNSTPGNYVQAIVAQTEPVYLAGVLGLTTVIPGAQAIAQVQQAAKPCILSLSGQISFQGSPNVNAPNCGMASNDTASNALNFTGGGMTINVGSLSAAGGCASNGNTTFCQHALVYSPPVTNPFAQLDAVTIPTLSKTGVCAPGSSLIAYSAATPCENDNVTFQGSSSPPALTGGVYFISGTLTLKGNNSLTGTGLLVLLPGASLSMKGNGTITITANASVSSSQVPAGFANYTTPNCVSTNNCLFNNMAIYDMNTSGSITFGGNSMLNFSGNIYAPKVDMTFQGNPTITVGSNSCSELIAKSVAFNGNATFDDLGCATGFHVAAPIAQVVALVQ